MSNGFSSKYRPLFYKSAGAVILLLAGLVLFFKMQPDETLPPLFEWITENHPASVITNGVDQLAVMESFGSLDSLVANECFRTLELDPREFQSKEQYQLITRFIADMAKYKSAESLETFIATVNDMMKMENWHSNDPVLHHFKSFPGSAVILESNRDSSIISAAYQIASKRLLELRSHNQIELLKKLAEQGIENRMRDDGILVTSATDIPADPKKILRHWELTGTRYILCQTGNAQISRLIQARYPQKYRPVYLNAVNAVLDPVRRRFHTVATFEARASEDETYFTFSESPTGVISLMGFEGALPYAKLYTDWRQGVGGEIAREILYSPGFLPQTQVVIREDDLPAPERPSLTVKMPSVKITAIDSRQSLLEVPAFDHNTVLFLRNLHSDGWEVKVSGNPAKVLHANLDSCAVYLEASDTGRTVVFKKP